MDKQDDIIGGNNTTSFVNYMFTMTDGEKIELVNTFQYIVLAIIPILLVIKLINNYVPPFDNKKSTVEISVELVVQLIILFSLFYFIHKLILFIPTYTKQQYPTVQFLPIVLPLIFILFNLDKNFGEKAQILMNRLLVVLGMKKENFEGADLDEEEQKQNEVIKNVIGQTCGPQIMPPQMSNPGTMMLEAPSRKTDRENPSQHQQQKQQYGISEPIAANEIGGFSMF